MGWFGICIPFFSGCWGGVNSGPKGGPLGCGFVTNNLGDCPRCMQTAEDTGILDFWWNWKIIPDVDTSVFSPQIASTVKKQFVPMVWGAAPPPQYDFLNGASYIMGFNEPDQFGPACVASWDPPAYGCAPGEDRQATSSGWANLFDPSIATNGEPRAAKYWQWMINNMTVEHLPWNRKPVKVVSPSMAQDAQPQQSCKGVDPSKEGSIKFCHGWLKVFKESTLQLPCHDFSGYLTNCWDVIDVIQIHAYSRTAQDVKDKVQGYYDVFEDDFNGRNGRKTKTLWITEVAAGSNNTDFIVPFVQDLMNSDDGLMNRDRFWFLEKVSWFSEYTFPSFKLPGYWPSEGEKWISTLFDPFGFLTPIGETFFSLCGGNIKKVEYGPGQKDWRLLKDTEGSAPSSIFM